MSLLGMATTAYGANNKLSAAEACRMASSQLLAKQGGEQKVEIKIDGCANFTPMFHRGLAKIEVSYSSSRYSEYMKARLDTKDLSDKCDFIHVNHGWKIDRCR